MADNFTAKYDSTNQDDNLAIFAADDVSGVLYCRNKITIAAGGTGSESNDLADTNPMPVGANTVKDGSGTKYSLLCDSDGNLQVDVVSVGTGALESGGNLAAAVTALQIMDDWDESNRAAVNLIASQAGITGGAGAVGASTPRVTLASDDPAVTLLGTIDTDTSALAGCVDGSELQVDVVSGSFSTVQNWEAPSAGSSGITSSSMNAGANLLSSEIDNETNLDTHLMLELTWTCSSASTVNSAVEVYILYALDGTNYEDGDASTDSYKLPVGAFYDDGGTGAQKQTIGPIPLMPFKFKVLLKSELDQNATSVALDVETFSRQNA